MADGRFRGGKPIKAHIPSIIFIFHPSSIHPSFIHPFISHNSTGGDLFETMRKSTSNTTTSSSNSRERKKITVLLAVVAVILCCCSLFISLGANNMMTAGSSSSNGIGFTSVQGLLLSTSTTVQSQSQSQSQRRQRHRQQSSLSLFNDATTNHYTFSSSSSTKSSRRHTNWYRQHQHLSNRRRPTTTTITSSAYSTTTGGGADVDVDDDSVNPSSASSSLKRRMVQILTGQKIINSSSSSSSSLKRPKCLQSIIDNNKNGKNKNNKYNTSKYIIQLLPIWIFHLRSSTQLIITFLIYIFHTVVLTQQSFLFPFQIISNNRGYYSSIGYDTLAGMITLGLYQYIRRNQKLKSETTTKPSSDDDDNQKNQKSIKSKSVTSTTITTTMLLSEEEDKEESSNSDDDDDKSYYLLPNLLSKPMTKDMPWKNIWNSNYSRISSGFTFLILVRTYFLTGRISLFWEDFLYGSAKYATWMTIPMHKSLTVLFGHTSWIVLASIILRLIPRPQSFFQQPTSMWFTSQYKNKNTSSVDKNKPESQLQPKPQQQKQQQWIWWVLGGYFVSCWFYNISDILNSYIFPLGILQMAEENSVVGSLLNTYDIKASLVGYIAPCITAPWFEEILYRGYLLPTLLLWLPSKSFKSRSRSSFQSKINNSTPSSSSSSSKDSDTNSKTNSLSYQLAIFISGILFSIHHQSELAFLPLCILGWLWAIIYTKSGNLWTTILIHSMWNSRIFIGGWFGL